MKTHPLLFIIITLIIGFILGFLTSSQLRHQRMKPVRIYSSEKRFIHDAYRFLQPDSLQAEKLEPVIKKYAKSSSDLHKEYRRDFEKIMNDYFSAVKPYLTEQQLEGIRQTERMRNDAIRRFRNDSTPRDSTPGKRHPSGRERGYGNPDFNGREPNRYPDSVNQNNKSLIQNNKDSLKIVTGS
jgi:hypothetical protein